MPEPTPRPCPFCEVAPWHRKQIGQVSCDNLECVLGAVRLPFEAWNAVADKCSAHGALVAALAKARNYVPCSCPPFSGGGGADPTCGWCEMGRALALALEADRE